MPASRQCGCAILGRSRSRGLRRRTSLIAWQSYRDGWTLRILAIADEAPGCRLGQRAVPLVARVFSLRSEGRPAVDILKKSGETPPREPADDGRPGRLRLAAGQAGDAAASAVGRGAACKPAALRQVRPPGQRQDDVPARDG